MGSFYILAAIFIWSSLPVFVRLLQVDIATLMFYSALTSVLLSGAILLGLRQAWPSGKGVALLLALGPLSLLNIFTYFYAMRHTSVANAVLTHYIAPVVVAFLAYAVFVVSFAVELSQLLWARWFTARGRLFGLPQEGFYRYAHRLVLFGFPMLSFAIFPGAAWAEEAWGRYWSWDPKEVWSLITWTVYAMYLHSKAVPAWRRNLSPALNILGFVCMVMTFLGVNWLAKLLGIPSLHAYAV